MLRVGFLEDRVVLHCGDCREVLVALPADGFDACVTDPPYHSEGRRAGSGENHHGLNDGSFSNPDEAAQTFAAGRF